MKKILAIVLVVIMMLSVAGCSEKIACLSCDGDVSKTASYYEHCGAKVVKKDSENESAQKKEITITLDNWDTYFEFVKKEEERINKYNELEDIEADYCFVLKEEYAFSPDGGTEINVEWRFKRTLKKYSLDLINKKVILSDIDSSPETVIEEATISPYYPSSFIIVGDRNLSSKEYKYQYTDFEVLRIYGTLVLCE